MRRRTSRSWTHSSSGALRTIACMLQLHASKDAKAACSRCAHYMQRHAILHVMAGWHEAALAHYPHYIPYIRLARAAGTRAAL